MNRTQETFRCRARQKQVFKQLTLKSFADMMGLSPTYISQIEREAARIRGVNKDELLHMLKVFNQEEWEKLTYEIIENLNKKNGH